jgi:hypothetical protein
MIIDPYRSLKAMAIPINLRDAMLHALEMAGAAHRRFAERDAEIKRRFADEITKTVTADLDGLRKLSSIEDSEHVERMEALREFNEALDRANRFLRAARGRPENTPRMASLRIAEKGFDDSGLDDAARDRLIKILTPAMTRQGIDPEEALRQGILLQRMHYSNES